MISMKTFGIFGKTAASGCGCALGQDDSDANTGEAIAAVLNAMAVCVQEYAAKAGVSEDVASDRFMDPAYEADFKPCVEAQMALITPTSTATPSPQDTVSVFPIGPMTKSDTITGTIKTGTLKTGQSANLALESTLAKVKADALAKLNAARPQPQSLADKLRAAATPRNLAILGGVAAAIFLLTPGKKTRSARTVPNVGMRKKRKPRTIWDVYPWTTSEVKTYEKLMRKYDASKTPAQKRAVSMELNRFRRALFDRHDYGIKANGSWMPTDYKVGGQYGAPMGRGRGSEKLTGKVHLRRVPLDRGGYDRGGAYWGVGAPLWVAWDDVGNEEYVRAPSREAAKAKLPAYKFYKN